MTFHEVSIAIRAENRATSVFRMVASDVMHLGVAFGALDSQTGRTVMQLMSIIRLATTMRAVIEAGTVSHYVHAASAKIVAAATWILNASLAAKVVLMTLGVGVTIVAAAAMAALAMQTSAAASATADYNREAEKTSRRGISRASEGSLLRRGVGF